MSERAGYTLVVYAIDVSPSMGEKTADPATGEQRVKLDLAKEFVARKCEPKVSLQVLTFYLSALSGRSRVGGKPKQSG